jgi:uncharacterized protein YbjT (DUF2867 family)
MKILVVGATGQLGTAAVHKLAAGRHSVRAFVRPTSNHQHLQGSAVELAFGDLRDKESVDAACTGANAVIATANTVIPQTKYSFDADEGQGYEALIAACQRHSVRRFVFMSVPVTPYDDKVPTFRLKRRIEQRLQQSGVPYTIFRGSLFMDDWLALIGSSIPLRGARAATLQRKFWFSRLFLKAVGHLIENHGLAIIPGSGKSRHAFIAVDDVAAFLVSALDRPQVQSAIFEIGGPEILSWDDAVAIFAKVLGRSIRAIHAPAEVFRIQQQMLESVSPASANLMGMNWLVSSIDTPYDMSTVAPMFGVSLTSVESFLWQKVRLPPN